MLTQDDKKWIENLLNTTLNHRFSEIDQRFKIEREFMRDFIIEGRRQDRAWVSEELLSLPRSSPLLEIILIKQKAPACAPGYCRCFVVNRPYFFFPSMI